MLLLQIVPSDANPKLALCSQPGGCTSAVPAVLELRLAPMRGAA